MNAPVPSSHGDDYASLLAKLKERIRTARLKAAVTVNEELILLYWSIGRDILNRQTEAGWGRGSSTASQPTSGATTRN